MLNEDPRISKIRFYPDRQHCKTDCAYFATRRGFSCCTLNGNFVGLRKTAWIRELRTEYCLHLTNDPVDP